MKLRILAMRIRSKKTRGLNAGAFALAVITFSTALPNVTNVIVFRTSILSMDSSVVCYKTPFPLERVQVALSVHPLDQFEDLLFTAVRLADLLHGPDGELTRGILATQIANVNALYAREYLFYHWLVDALILHLSMPPTSRFRSQLVDALMRYFTNAYSIQHRSQPEDTSIGLALCPVFGQSLQPRLLRGQHECWA